MIDKEKYVLGRLILLVMCQLQEVTNGGKRSGMQVLHLVQLTFGNKGESENLKTA